MSIQLILTTFFYKAQMGKHTPPFKCFQEGRQCSNSTRFNYEA